MTPFDIGAYVISLLIFIRMSISMRKMRQRLAVVSSIADTAVGMASNVEESIGQIYLTAEERKQLGIPTPTVPDLPAPEKPPVLACKPSRHQWPAHHIGAPRLPSNQQRAEPTQEYVGMAVRRGYKIPVRVCIVCGAREVRNKYGEWFID